MVSNGSQRCDKTEAATQAGEQLKPVWNQCFETYVLPPLPDPDADIDADAAHLRLSLHNGANLTEEATELSSPDNDLNALGSIDLIGTELYSAIGNGYQLHTLTNARVGWLGAKIKWAKYTPPEPKQEAGEANDGGPEMGKGGAAEPCADEQQKSPPKPKMRKVTTVWVSVPTLREFASRECDRYTDACIGRMVVRAAAQELQLAPRLDAVLQETDQKTLAFTGLAATLRIRDDDRHLYFRPHDEELGCILASKR